MFCTIRRSLKAFKTSICLSTAFEQNFNVNKLTLHNSDQGTVIRKIIRSSRYIISVSVELVAMIGVSNLTDLCSLTEVPKPVNKSRGNAGRHMSTSSIPYQGDVSFMSFTCFLLRWLTLCDFSAVLWLER